MQQKGEQGDQYTVHWIRLYEFLDNRLADRDWMLEVINHINPDHMYFGKGYRPPTIANQLRDMPVANNDGFFDGLPVSTSKASRNNFAALTGDERYQMQVALEQAKLDRLKLQYERQQMIVQRHNNPMERGGIDDFNVMQLLDGNRMQMPNIAGAFG